LSSAGLQAGCPGGVLAASEPPICVMQRQERRPNHIYELPKMSADVMLPAINCTSAFARLPT
jgi:hypothetical protein